jgi:hypothetical protein
VTALHLLWLPILLSAVMVFVVSSIVHMVVPWHKSDFVKLPDEDKVMDALRPFAIPPGDYMVPRPATQKDMRSAEFLDKLKRGPVLVVTVLPNGPMPMGRNLLQWFIYSAVVGALAAYVTGRALPPGAEYRQVFRSMAATTFIAYSAALWPSSIWYRRSWATTIKLTVDGLIYALFTAGTFGWLWPR